MHRFWMEPEFWWLTGVVGVWFLLLSTVLSCVS